MRFTRRRSDRPDSAQSRLGSSLEVLETRALMSRGVLGLFSQYAPNDLPITNPITHEPVPYSVYHQMAYNHRPNDPLFTNQGKIISGKDRASNEWTITVHGPGYAIVTDTTPNDGVLNDDLATITLVGTDINQTYVTGNVVASFRVQTGGTIPFNRLVAQQGVRSIVLNGFDLQQTVAPLTGEGNNATTGIYLLGGVRYLEFNDIVAPVDLATSDTAVNVVIGDPNSPLRVEPTIKLENIYTTVFDSSNQTDPPTPPTNGPVTIPSVNIIVNGQIRGLDIFSATQSTVDASQQFLFPAVATTGRTSIQTIGIDNLRVRGAATNLTASRASQPFQNGFSGMSRLNHAAFNGPTDAVGIDVNGPIRSIRFRRGLGNPTGSFIGQTSGGQVLPATSYGTPVEEYGYAASGYVGGQVTATNIGQVNVGPANAQTYLPQNPDYRMLYRQGNTTTYAVPGTAMVNAAIVSSGSIGDVTVVGQQVNSEVKAGFHYPSFAAGLEGTRSPASIRRVHQAGDMVNGVTSASYRPAGGVYGAPGSTSGRGSISGRYQGSLYATGAITPLLNQGAGFYARTKNGYLPPPQGPARLHGRIVR